MLTHHQNVNYRGSILSTLWLCPQLFLSLQGKSGRHAAEHTGTLPLQPLFLILSFSFFFLVTMQLLGDRNRMSKQVFLSLVIRIHVLRTTQFHHVVTFFCNESVFLKLSNRGTPFSFPTLHIAILPSYINVLLFILFIIINIFMLDTIKIDAIHMLLDGIL